jgi:rRNA maturation protein Nop10
VTPSRLANFSALIEEMRFARDSPLEEDGFEPSVPPPHSPADRRLGPASSSHPANLSPEDGHQSPRVVRKDHTKDIDLSDTDCPASAR